MKLSKTQLEILKLMNSGWELGYNSGNWWIQKGGLGYGGESKWRINYRTIYKLIKLEFIIKNKEGFPTTSYKLTDKGKSND